MAGSTSNLVLFPPGGRSRQTTLGSLVDYVDSLPVDRVLSLLLDHVHVIGDVGADPDAAMLRHLVVLGALINRALFEVHALPKDRGSPI